MSESQLDGSGLVGTMRILNESLKVSRIIGKVLNIFTHMSFLSSHVYNLLSGLLCHLLHVYRLLHRMVHYAQCDQSLA